MAFIVPRNPLSPARKLSLGLAPGTRVLRAADLAAWVDAQALMAQAQLQADAIVASAQADYQAECARGFETGQEDARMEQVEQMMENIAQTIDYFAKVETSMVDLVMKAVRKIIDDFDDGERVLMTVKNVLSVVRNQKQMTLRLHPQQVDGVKERVNDLLAAYPGVGYIDILADNRLKLGACILESEIGLVEASMEGQLAALQSAFSKILGSRV
ncbi:MAG: HrpE/YscL family type III secretion apparatus protein [Polaromonas sp.]|nr:HrpE/YscL family type III secretion apparatus protein [Polaromonas sp.]